MDEAFEEQRLASELEPANAFGPCFAAYIQFFRGRPAETVPLFQALSRDSQHGFAWMTLGEAHVALGHFDEARWCIERAIALEGVSGATATVGASAYLGECLRLSGQLPAAREACLAGLRAIERSDHMYRDSVRAAALCILARTALDQGDTVAARAALHQALAQVSGRERSLGGGFLAIQAMAGLARAGEGAEWLDQAQRLFECRDRFNFSVLWTCSDDATLVELGRAALTLGRPEGLAALERARQLGSLEAGGLLEKGGAG